MNQPLPQIDVHVHMVGNGSGNSGCWLRMHKVNHLQSKLMLHHLGLPGSALYANLEELYLNRILQFVRHSSLDAIVLLANEQAHDASGKPMDDVGSAYIPNEYILQLGKQHPEILPAVSIHPARPDAIETLEHCVAEGAVLMKCLPSCQNIDCNLPQYRPFWEKMAELGLPLLAHTGDEHTLEVIRPELNTPRTLIQPLECGVSVIAAHCGTQSVWWDHDYFPEFLELIRKYPNFYGDLSAFNLPARGKAIPQCLCHPVSERVIHGSDVPIPVYGTWNWMRGLIDTATLWKWGNDPNPIERDYQYKRAMGFSDEVFTRVNDLFPRNIYER